VNNAETRQKCAADELTAPQLARQCDVVVIGGGISGLATACYLARQGKQVQLFEQADRSGGKIATSCVDGYVTEAAASMLMNFLPEVEQFLVDSQMVDSKTMRHSSVGQNRFMLKDGRLWPISMKAASFFSNGFLDLNSKLRLMLEWAVPAHNQADETVENFISRRLGKQLLEQAIEPFVAGTLACDVKLASADAVLPRLKALEKKYGSITAGILVNKLLRRRTAATPEVFSFDGGMQTLIDKLSRERNFSLHLNTGVTALEKCHKGWRISIASVESNKARMQQIEARQIVMATPANVTAKLLQSCDPSLAKVLAGIKYAPMNLVHLGFNQTDVPHALNGIGFLVPKAENSSLLGNLWMSSVFAQRAPQGKVLLTSYLGGSRLPEVGSWSDQHCIRQVRNNLKKYLNIDATPDMLRLDRHKAALPLYHGDYAQKTRWIKQRLSNHQGLFINANYLDGVSVRDRIVQARQTAELMQNKHGEKSLIQTGCQCSSITTSFEAR